LGVLFPLIRTKKQEGAGVYDKKGSVQPVQVKETGREDLTSKGRTGEGFLVKRERGVLDPR